MFHLDRHMETLQWLAMQWEPRIVRDTSLATSRATRYWPRLTKFPPQPTPPPPSAAWPRPPYMTANLTNDRRMNLNYHLCLTHVTTTAQVTNYMTNHNVPCGNLKEKNPFTTSASFLATSHLANECGAQQLQFPLVRARLTGKVIETGIRSTSQQWLMVQEKWDVHVRDMCLFFEGDLFMVWFMLQVRFFCLWCVYILSSVSQTNVLRLGEDCVPEVDAPGTVQRTRRNSTGKLGRPPPIVLISVLNYNTMKA
jgi:hypothetical protein